MKVVKGMWWKTSEIKPSLYKENGISISDRVLIYSSSIKIVEAAVYMGVDGWYNDEDFLIENVIYWMDMPIPPTIEVDVKDVEEAA